ncbi:hypothetical protein CEQ90_11150 [Lewinellaceae bacterium SD302]|nr:hypothetical protein CEQ90_11150 [Lewinellaceae bacterium SD302]
MLAAVDNDQQSQSSKWIIQQKYFLFCWYAEMPEWQYRKTNLHLWKNVFNFMKTNKKVQI